MHMMKIKDTKQLSTLTGMSTLKIDRCKRILSYPKKYQDILLLADNKDRIRPDFFVELYPVLERIPKVMPKFYNKYSRDDIIDRLLEKFREGKISAAREFRILRKLLDYVKDEKMPREIAEKFFIRLIEDRDTTIDEIFRELDIEFVTELDKTRRICDSLTRSLSKIEKELLARNPEFGRSLRRLRKQIDRLTAS